MHVELEIGGLTEALSGRSWEPARMRREIARRAAAFLASGIGRGDRVFLHFGNRLEFFAELLAIWQVGACAVPIDARLTAFEVGTLARAATPALCVVGDETDGSTLDGLGQVRVRHTDDLAGSTDAAPLAGPRLDDDALILFTSGTTGAPKGVVHTHRSLRARWLSLRQSLGTESYRRTLCLLPTHFGHGLICNCLFPWLSGQELFITPPFRPDLLLKLGALIDRHAITFLSSVPSMWRLALKTACAPTGGTLRRIHVGSAPLAATLWREIAAWAAIEQVFNAYGITETGSWVAGTSGAERVQPEDGLIGVPWGAVIRVLREDGSTLSPDSICAPGEPGSVWINTPALMRGYFERQELTDAVVRDGWFHTGDIGFTDELGRLWLKGRKRDEINKGGMKIHPADVDSVVERFAAVRDVCTFGYADEAYGEEVGIAIVLADGREETLAALLEWVRSHLAAHKVPRRWYVVDEIPRTSRGKVSRAEVAERCARLSPQDMRPARATAAGAERP